MKNIFIQANLNHGLTLRKPQRDMHLLKMIDIFFCYSELIFENGSLYFENGSLFYECGPLFYENGS